MRLSEYIKALQDIEAAEGDLEVNTHSCGGERVAARTPIVAHKRILQGREKLARFAMPGPFGDAPELVGEKVVQV